MRLTRSITKRLCSQYCWSAFFFALSVPAGSALAELESYQTSGARSANALTSLTLNPRWANVAAPLTAADLKERVLLVGIWRSSHPQATSLQLELRRLEQKYGDVVTALSIHAGKFPGERRTEQFESILQRFNVFHPAINDVDQTVLSNLGITRVPSIVLIGLGGEIFKVYDWEGVASGVEKDLQFLVSKFASKVVAEKFKRKPIALRGYPETVAVVKEYKGAPLLVVAYPNLHQLWGMRTSGQVEWVVGKEGIPGFTDGAADQAAFTFPRGLAVANQLVYVADSGNHAIRRLDLEKWQVDTLAGTGQTTKPTPLGARAGKTTPLHAPEAIAVFPSVGELAVAQAAVHQIWFLTIPSAQWSLAAGATVEGFTDGSGYLSHLSNPGAMAVADQRLFFLDSGSSSLRVLERGKITSLIGKGVSMFGRENGDKDEALMQYPRGLVYHKDALLIADTFNHQIRRYDFSTKAISVLVGKRGPGLENGNFIDARFDEPRELASVDGKVYVVDTNNRAVRVVDIEKSRVSTLKLVGPPVSRRIASPTATGRLRIKLDLLPGWKLAQPKSTYLALYDARAKNAELSRRNLSQLGSASASFDSLQSGGTYQLRGALFFCKDGAAAQCSQKQVDQAVQIPASGVAELAITLAP